MKKNIFSLNKNHYDDGLNMVPTGSWKREKFLDLKKIYINRGKSLILINLWCFAVNSEKHLAAATAGD